MTPTLGLAGSKFRGDQRMFRRWGHVHIVSSRSCLFIWHSPFQSVQSRRLLLLEVAVQLAHQCILVRHLVLFGLLFEGQGKEMLTLLVLQ